MFFIEVVVDFRLELLGGIGVDAPVLVDGAFALDFGFGLFAGKALDGLYFAVDVFPFSYVDEHGMDVYGWLFFLKGRLVPDVGVGVEALDGDFEFVEILPRGEAEVLSVDDDVMVEVKGVFPFEDLDGEDGQADDVPYRGRKGVAVAEGAFLVDYDVGLDNRRRIVSCCDRMVSFCVAHSLL